MSHTRVNFIMKKPGGGRKSFSILRRTFSKDLVQYQVVKIEALSAINKAYLSGLQQYSECEVSVREVIKRLYAEENRKYPAQVYNSQNRQLLEKYWKAEYVSRDLVDSCSAKNDLKRAIEAVGSLSLYSSSKEEIQNQISKSLKGNQQRRVVSRLNQILKFLGRDIKLRKDKSVPHEIRHLSLSEFQSVVERIENPEIQLLCRVAFFTGARIGELFALNSSSFRETSVFINAQIDREGIRRLTKQRNFRKAFIIPEGREAVEAWCNRDFELPRTLKYADILKEVCKIKFPKKSEKWCVFHDLRHSYAIYLLNRGISLSLVAQCLGNSIAICQTHYAGFTLADDTIDAIEQRLQK